MSDSKGVRFKTITLSDIDTHTSEINHTGVIGMRPLFVNIEGEEYDNYYDDDEDIEDDEDDTDGYVAPLYLELHKIN